MFHLQQGFVAGGNGLEVIEAAGEAQGDLRLSVLVRAAVPTFE